MEPSLEERMMEREKFFQRSDRAIPKEAHQHDHKYVMIWKDTVDYFTGKYQGFVEQRLMDKPEIQKEFIDKLLENMSTKARELYKDKGNAVAGLPPEDDARIRLSDSMPGEGYLREQIKTKKADFNLSSYMQAIQQWDHNPRVGRYAKLESVKSEYVKNDPEDIKAVFKKYLSPDVHPYVNWDLALAKRDHAVGLLEKIEYKRKVLENAAKTQGIEADITEKDLTIGLHEVWDNEYIMRDKSKLKKMGLKPYKTADDYHQTEYKKAA